MGKPERNYLGRTFVFLRDVRHLEKCERHYKGMLNTSEEDCTCGLYDAAYLLRGIRAQLRREERNEP